VAAQYCVRKSSRSWSAATALRQLGQRGRILAPDDAKIANAQGKFWELLDSPATFFLQAQRYAQSLKTSVDYRSLQVEPGSYQL
jgi:hypothetical protein